MASKRSRWSIASSATITEIDILEANRYEVDEFFG
jgi:hypothetical protein